MSKLELRVEMVEGSDIANLARFAHYIGVVAQINGSLIEEVLVTGRRNAGPETTSADGKVLTLGAAALPRMHSAKPSAIAAWCGASLHGFAHSRYSPRADEPLRGSLHKGGLHRTWNMIEDARIERLLLREFPGWQPHLMGAVNHILLTPPKTVGGNVGHTHKPNLSNVFPLLVGRTYLPAALRQESYEAFAEEHSEYIADAVEALVMEYLTVMDPGSEDHDQTLDIVKRLHALLGDFGTDCGSHDVGSHNETERQWTDPGDPAEDDDEDESDGNHEVTPDEDGESDDDGSQPGDDGDESDESGDGDGDGEQDDDDADGDGDGGDGDAGSDDEAEGNDESSDEPDSDGDFDSPDGSDGEGGGGTGTSRLADWSSAIDSALASDERLNEVAEAVRTGPMPLIRLPKRPCEAVEFPLDARQAEGDIQRELRKLMDGARPGMRRRIDRGRFNVARVVREGGATRPEEMFDRHDPGALRSTGCAVTVLADVSGSMSEPQITGAMSSMWAIEHAVRSIRGQFQGYTFGKESHEMPVSTGTEMWVPRFKDGGTRPVGALSAAQAWLSQQREPNKLCIVATDGAWDGAVYASQVLHSMVEQGVQVAVFGIDCDVTRRFGESSPIGTYNIDSAAQLGPAVGQMLLGRIRKSLHR